MYFYISESKLTFSWKKNSLMPVKHLRYIKKVQTWRIVYGTTKVYYFWWKFLSNLCLKLFSVFFDKGFRE